MHVSAPTLLRTVALVAPLLLALNAPVARGQGAPAATSAEAPALPDAPAAASASSGDVAVSESPTASGPDRNTAPASPEPSGKGAETANASSKGVTGKAATSSAASQAVKGSGTKDSSPAPRTEPASARGPTSPAGIVNPSPRRQREDPVAVEAPHGGSRWRLAGAAEFGVQPIALSPREADVFLSLTPILALGYDGVFALELGAPLRLHSGTVVGAQPMQFRAEDWDELSDFGQILRGLRIGRETDAFSLWAGPLTLETLGRGALVSRYGNGLLATRSPAGARVRAEVGGVRTEVLASDVLALRLLAAEVRLDGGHLLAGGANAAGRWHVTLGAAHDAGDAETDVDGITLASLELDAVLWRLPTFQLAAFLGGGARLGAGGGHLGGQVGLELEAQLPHAVFGGRVAARRGSGGYRPGFFGADHELARLAGQGLTTAPLADLRLPAGYSGHALVQLGFGAQGEEDVPDARGNRGTASVAVEVFQSGRTDLEAAYQLDFIGQGLSLAGRLGATGLGETTRSWVSLEGRGRLSPSIYVVAAAGTAFAPREGGGLTRGWTATAGVGFDFDARP